MTDYSISTYRHKYTLPPVPLPRFRFAERIEQCRVILFNKINQSRGRETSVPEVTFPGVPQIGPCFPVVGGLAGVSLLVSATAGIGNWVREVELGRVGCHPIVNKKGR
jgi:hypothetical protein